MGGKSGGSTTVKMPKLPKPPPPPPAPIEAGRKAAAKRGFGGNATPENVRNVGGARGVSTADAQRAIKYLSGKS